MIKKHKNILIIISVVLILLLSFFLIRFIIKSNNKRNLIDPNEVTTQANVVYTTINYNDYKKLIDNEKSFMLVLGDTKCSACNRYTVALKQLKKEYGIRIYYINYHKYEKEFGSLVSKEPTTLFYIDGKLSKKLDGNSPYENLKKVLDDLGY